MDPCKRTGLRNSVGITRIESSEQSRITSPWELPSGVSAKILRTEGINALSTEDQLAIFAKVRNFNEFTEDNDPHGEHDFGSFDHKGEKIFWKIDYHAPDMLHGSENPADPSQTVRVLTIMLAEGY